MINTSRLVFVDCEARGASPINGTMTEFGAVIFDTRDTFHGRLFEGRPDPDNPAIPLLGKFIALPNVVASDFNGWLRRNISGNPVMVSDNIAYDWQWISALFDGADIPNPFGHSGRRLSDFYAGLTGKWSNTQAWKRHRKTRHDHNPVNDAMGNVEAFATIIKEFNL